MKKFIVVVIVCSAFVGMASASDFPFSRKSSVIPKLGGDKFLRLGKNGLIIMYGSYADILKTTGNSGLKRVGHLNGMRMFDAILADANNDGVKDLICAGFEERISGGEKMKEGVAGVFFGSKNGFDEELELLEAEDSEHGVGVAAGDVNGDGIKDLIVVMKKGGMAIFFGNKKKGETAGAKTLSFPEIDGTQVVAADFDGDGVDEVAVSRFQTKHRIYKFNSKTGKLDKVWESLKKGQSPSVLTTADVNKDGKPDLIQGGRGFWESEKIQIYLSGKEKYFNPKPDFGYTPPADETLDIPKSILFDNFNKDGALDMIVGFTGHEKKANFGGKIFFLLNDGKGAFKPSSTIFSTGCELTLLDVNGDRKKDLLSSTPYHPRLKKINVDCKKIYVHPRK